jgi:arginyl-tRNA synthetase
MDNKLAKIVGKLEHTENFEHGDYASNIALIQAKKEGKNPKEVAEDLAEQFRTDSELKDIVEKIEVAGPGFINFFLKGIII